MTDIAELFSTDPLKLTRENRAEMIQVYRAARTQFHLGNAQAGSSKKLKEKAPKITALDLDELLDETHK